MDLTVIHYYITESGFLNLNVFQIWFIKMNLLSFFSLIWCKLELYVLWIVTHPSLFANRFTAHHPVKSFLQNICASKIPHALPNFSPYFYTTHCQRKDAMATKSIWKNETHLPNFRARLTRLSSKNYFTAPFSTLTLPYLFNHIKRWCTSV